MDLFSRFSPCVLGGREAAVALPVVARARAGASGRRNANGKPGRANLFFAIPSFLLWRALGAPHHRAPGRRGRSRQRRAPGNSAMSCGSPASQSEGCAAPTRVALPTCRRSFSGGGASARACFGEGPGARGLRYSRLGVLRVSVKACSTSLTCEEHNVDFNFFLP